MRDEPAFRRIAHLVLVALLVPLAAGCGDSAEEQRARQEAEATRALMRQIFGAISVALPASAEPGQFGDPASRERIGTALKQLADNAEGLERHTRRSDEQAQFLARSIARDAREVERAYAHGQHDRAAFLVQQITENCIVCHTRLPDREDSPVARGFVEDGVFATMPPEPRANLQMATRRFDEALRSLEELLASQEHAATMLGPLTDYLVVSVRVKGDYERPIPVLKRFADREDVWTSLRRDVLRWADVLPKLGARAQARPDLATAREFLDEGLALSPVPRDYAPLAHWVAASAILERIIDQRAVEGTQLAEAYYLLGLVEARIGRHYWVTPAPFLLENAIRLAPGEEFAEDAYATLEMELLAAWEGTGTQTLPPEEAERLRELRALLDEAS
jgi:tetratricopeptide (TPR) repeat protein